MSDTVRFEVNAALESFRWNEAGYKRMMQISVMPDLVRRAIKVENAAKRIASNVSVSAPGEGPGVVTGRLRASITWRPGEDAYSPYVDIGSAVTYAPYLEFGTSKMEARPFLRPALEAARE
jgi:HK97 gp10 family phage protein